VFRTELDARLDAMDAPAAVRSAMTDQVSRLADADVPASAPASLRPELERAFAQAFLRSFRVSMLIAAAFAAISGVCAALTIRE
jgi:hypothetical protein